MNIEELRAVIQQRSRECSSCGKKVLFVTDDKGTNQVLDLIAPVFIVERINGTLKTSRKPATYVSHFATCPNATKHSNAHKAKGAGNNAPDTAVTGPSYEKDAKDVRALCEIDEGLNDKEKAFVESVSKWVLDKQGRMSAKQRKWVSAILERSGR